MVARLRVMIVEDEPLATRRLLSILGKLPDVEIVGLAENGRVALDIISTLRPDLLLLDIEMPGLGGFDLLERMPDNVAPAVIFVTAFDCYAAKAFAVRAVDFVLKPVVAERLQAALANARRDLATREVEAKLVLLQEMVVELRAQAAAAAGPYSRELWVQQRNELIRVPTAEIDWIEAEKDYVRIHRGPSSYLLHGMIGALEEKLDPGEFIRVHRSAIVRMDRVRSVRRSRYGALDIQLLSDTNIRVGRKYDSRVRSRIAAGA